MARPRGRRWKEVAAGASSKSAAEGKRRRGVEVGDGGERLCGAVSMSATDGRGCGASSSSRSATEGSGCAHRVLLLRSATEGRGGEGRGVAARSVLPLEVGDGGDLLRGKSSRSATEVCGGAVRRVETLLERQAERESAAARRGEADTPGESGFLSTKVQLSLL